MSAFSSLNGRTLTFTDNRLPNVVTNFPVAFSISETGESNVLTLKRNIEIVDVVKPDLADCRLIVDVSTVAGTTMDWGTLPVGVTVTETNGVYTARGINSQAIWDTIKEPTITIPPGFQGSFSYDVDLRFYNGTDTTIIDWNVGTFVPVSNFKTVSTISVEAKKIAGLVSTNLVGIFNLLQVFTELQIFANTSLSVIPEYLFTDKYLELIEDGFYDPFTTFNISDYSPRITNNTAAPSTVYDFEISSNNENVTVGYSGYYDKGNLNYIGEFNAFTASGSRLATFDASKIARIYNFPAMTLINQQNLSNNGGFTKFSKSGIDYVNYYKPSSDFVQRWSQTSNTVIAFLKFSSFNKPRVVSLTRNGVLFCKLENDINLEIYDFTDSNMDHTAARVGIITRPEGIGDWGYRSNSHSDVDDNDNWLQTPSTGEKCLIGASYAIPVGGTGFSTFLATTTNFSPYAYSLVEFKDTISPQNTSINNCVKNENFTLLAFGNKLYDDTATLIQTFNDEILAISNDESIIITTGTDNNSKIFVGNPSIGYTFDSLVYGNTNYFEINSTNDLVLSKTNYAELVNENSNALTITNTKSIIHKALGNLEVTANLLPDEEQPYDFIINYNLVFPGGEYNRVVYFNDFTVSAELSSSCSITTIIGKIIKNSVTLSSKFNVLVSIDKNVVDFNPLTITSTSSLTAISEKVMFADAYTQVLDQISNAGKNVGTAFSVSVPSSIQHLDGMRILIHTTNTSSAYIQPPADFSQVISNINPARAVYARPYVNTDTPPYVFSVSPSSFYMTNTLRLSADNTSTGWTFNGTGNTVSFNLPTIDYQLGNLLLVYVLARASTTISRVTTAPSGWKSISFNEQTYLNHHSNAIAGKTVTDTNIGGTTVTWNFATAGTPILEWYVIFEKIVNV